MVGAFCFILDVEVELLQVCGPLLMEFFLQFDLCLHELQWLMISVDDCLLPRNVMSLVIYVGRTPIVNVIMYLSW
jgi:hypothetical protein